MKIAYMIQAHKNYEQLCLLINNLDSTSIDIYIHIDRKNDNLYNALKCKYATKDNIYLVKNRIDVNWSGFSQVQATLNMIDLVIKSNKVYDYVSLISGQDFPIKNDDYIKEYLKANNGKEFIECKNIGTFEWRLKCYNFFTENKYNRKVIIRIIDNILRYIQKKVFKRNNFKNIELYYGSQWFTLTYECIKYIHTYLLENEDFIKNFKYTACSDEHFFQIIIMNSEYKNNVINNNLRYIDWGQCLNSPKTLNSNDLDNILQSEHIIARKFDIEVDRNVVVSICNHINKCS